MKVKIDTKEKFHVITPEGPVLSANMTEGLNEVLLPFLQTEIKNIALQLSEVSEIEKTLAESIFNIQRAFYENKASFVICGMQKPVEEIFKQLDLLGVLNWTPTESEAGDIIQMEEIEREFTN